jgi:lipoate-protein ligase A
MDWDIIETEAASAQENMRLDEKLLEELGQKPILHLYDWKTPSATYGYFLDPAKFLDIEKVKKHGLDLARRPTGGGIVFHIWDLAFSVLIPACSPHYSTNTLENYRYVNGVVQKAIKEFIGKDFSLISADTSSWDKSCESFCMARPTQYDVVLEGKKVVGAAQRKRKHGFLHQGTIALSLPNEEFLQEILLPGTRVKQAILEHTLPILGARSLEKGRKEMRNLLKRHFIHE